MCEYSHKKKAIQITEQESQTLSRFVQENSKNVIQ
jgi:hypothetical protein